MVGVLYALSVVFFGLTAWCSQTALAEVRSSLPNSFSEDDIRVAADYWVWDRSMPNRARRYTVWEGVWFSLACASASTGL